MQQYLNITHTFAPVWDENSKILILGSFPSVASREQGFYYGHPRNRFWKVLARVLDSSEPRSTPEKRRLLLGHGIALWDAAASCSITGSADSAMRDVVPNDFGPIFAGADIRAVYTNGGKAHELYCKYCEAQTGLPAVKLPSTSPANAAWSLEKLCGEWEQIRRYL